LDERQPTEGRAFGGRARWSTAVIESPSASPGWPGAWLAAAHAAPPLSDRCNRAGVGKWKMHTSRENPQFLAARRGVRPWRLREAGRETARGAEEKNSARPAVVMRQGRGDDGRGLAFHDQKILLRQLSCKAVDPASSAWASNNCGSLRTAMRRLCACKRRAESARV